MSSPPRIENRAVSLATLSIECKQTVAFNGRKLVLLPANVAYRHIWEEYGVEWLEELNENSYKAKALLPVDWTFKEGASIYPNLIVCNENGEEVLAIHEIVKPVDSWISVHKLSPNDKPRMINP